MAKLIIYVAKENTPFHEVDGHLSHSSEGHMFIAVQDKDGLHSWGFQPHGVVPDEHKQYFKTTQVAFDITEKKAQEIITFAQTAENDNRKTGDWAMLTNSCVDFAWKALNIAGIKSPSLIWNEGKIYPEDNIKLLKEAQEIYKLKQKHSYLLPQEILNSNQLNNIDKNIKLLVNLRDVEVNKFQENSKQAFLDDFDNRLSNLFQTGKIIVMDTQKLENKLESKLQEQASNEHNQKNELGFSKASVDKHNEENSIALSQNQSQGRRLG